MSISSPDARRAMVRALALAAGLVAGVAEAEAEEPLTLALPVACELGKTCFLQSYVDVSGPGEEPRDHACGIATFKGHTGTDFRLLSAQAAEQGVAVLAAAKGRVLKVHNGMPDALVRPRRPAIIEGLACGNHVVIDHGQGWQTQYCHLRLDSIKVTPGQEALPGETLGLVGHSGNAGYAHLHFMVRKDDLVVDPFSGVAPAAKCPTDGGARMPLWDAKALLAMPYRMSEFIEAGFADARVSVGLLEQGQAKLTSPNGQSQDLVLYARILNVRAGDRVRLVIEGPDGFRAEELSEAVERNQVVHLAQISQRRRRLSWRLGPYRGTIALLRRQDLIAERVITLDLR